MEHGVPALWRNLHDLKQVQTRTFHLAWSSFFVCAIAWMGLMPVTGVIKQEFGLTSDQISWVAIATLALAIFARPFAGWLCDMYGPRKTYAGLLFAGSIPVFFSGLAWNFETFIIARALVGCIGGTFVVTIYHATMMFGPNIVGQACGTATGWGTFGAGTTHLILPTAAVGFVGFGYFEISEWRLVMMFCGVLMVLFGMLYLKGTQDTPIGNFDELRSDDLVPQRAEIGPCWKSAATDYRTWVMAAIYGVCVGLEIAVISFGSLYFIEMFGLDMVQAGLIIGAFGILNIVGRGFGGFLADWMGSAVGLRGRSFVLFACLLIEGIALIFFSQAENLAAATITLLVFSFFTQMAEGATYAITPFLKRGSLGAISGIVAGGGTIGALLAAIALIWIPDWNEAFFMLGVFVVMGSGLAFLVTFSSEEENAERSAIASSSLESVQKKLNLMRGLQNHWRWKQDRYDGIIGKIAGYKVASLHRQIHRLEDILDEGISHQEEKRALKEKPHQPVHLRIVWDATKKYK
jgi:MFS transporter, NNP family, nitrate/nitrite transporter